MIKLELLNEVCQNCPHFEVEQYTQTHTSIIGATVYYHMVSCKHLNKCRELEHHLQKEAKTNGK